MNHIDLSNIKSMMKNVGRQYHNVLRQIEFDLECAQSMYRGEEYRSNPENALAVVNKHFVKKYKYEFKDDDGGSLTLLVKEAVMTPMLSAPRFVFTTLFEDSYPHTLPISIKGEYLSMFIDPDESITVLPKQKLNDSQTINFIRVWPAVDTNDAPDDDPAVQLISMFANPGSSECTAASISHAAVVAARLLLS